MEDPDRGSPGESREIRSFRLKIPGERLAGHFCSSAGAGELSAGHVSWLASPGEPFAGSGEESAGHFSSFAGPGEPSAGAGERSAGLFTSSAGPGEQSAGSGERFAGPGEPLAGS